VLLCPPMRSPEYSEAIVPHGLARFVAEIAPSRYTSRIPIAALRPCDRSIDSGVLQE
jgi:hypothetical protein